MNRYSNEKFNGYNVRNPSITGYDIMKEVK